MSIVFFTAFLIFIVYLLFKNNVGTLLCMLTLFPEVPGIITSSVGLFGYNMIFKYFLFACILWNARERINTDWQNLFRHPVSILLYILIIVLYITNEFVIGEIEHNEEIAAFQQNVFIRILIPFIIVLLSANKESILVDYCKAIPIWGLIFFLVFTVLIGLSGVDLSDRLEMADKTGIASISLSRYGTASLLGSLVSLLCEKRKGWRIFYIVMLFISFFMLLVASQRGAIIGTAIATILTLALVLIRQGKMKQFLWITGAIGISVIVLVNFFDFEIMHRFQDIGNYKSYERYNDYFLAWKAFGENDYLSGLGSMGYMKYTNGFRQYPHSIVLELMVEYGLAGLIFAVVAVGGGCVMCVRILKIITTPIVEMAVPVVWMGLLFSVLVSGNMVTNAAFFLITGMLIIVYQNRNNLESHKKTGQAIAK